MNAIIYCRVSSKEQVDGTSLDVQGAACNDYAKAHQMTIIREFVEQGESAKFADRTKLIELMEFCRKHKGEVQTLLVWKVDRFARNVSDHFSIKATLLRYGVRVVSVTEAIGTNPEGQLMETILAGFAQFDNDVRAMRTVHGMRKRVQEGIQPWHAPLGYKSSHQKGERKNLPDMEDQPTFDLLKIAWERFATGAYTKRDIRRLLKSLGVVSKRGEFLADQSIDKIFSNPFYAGILVDPWSGEEIIGRHPPMVSPEDFARVQQVIFRRNRSKQHEKYRAEFPLRGLIRCSECQHRLSGSFSTGRSSRYPYYHCKNKVCSQRTKSLPVAKTDSEFIGRLHEIALNPQFVEPFRGVLLDIAKQQDATVGVSKAQVSGQLDRVDRQLNELIALRAREVISDTEFDTHRNRLKSERYELTSQIASFGPTTLDEVEDKLEAVIRILAAPAEVWKELRTQLRGRFYELVFPNGICVGQSRTAETGLIFGLLPEKCIQETDLVTLRGVEPRLQP